MFSDWIKRTDARATIAELPCIHDGLVPAYMGLMVLGLNDFLGMEWMTHLFYKRRQMRGPLPN